MKVLFISHSAAPSGAEIFLLRLASAMGESEPEFLFMRPGPMVDQFRQAGFKVTVAPRIHVDISREDRSVRGFVASTFKLLRSGWSLASTPGYDEIDVVIAQSVKSLVLGWPLARRRHKPLVWSVHDRLSPDYLGKVKATLVRVLAGAIPDAFIANSRSTLATMSVGKKPHVVIYPGLNMDEFSPGDENDPTTDRAHLVVVNVGRLAEWKGQHVFIEAFDKAFPDDDTQGIVVGGALFGEEAYAERIAHQANSLQSGSRLTLTGHIDDVRPVLHRADIVVHSSIIPEPFGSVIIEGMAMGKPVIATRPGGPEEIISDGIDGVLIPGNDVRAMSAALTRLAGNPALRLKLGTQARDRAEFFGIERQARNLESWLRSWVK